ncbi:Transposition protein B [Neorhizobium galegae bv. officinalis bv. officinalis str. HAMBI 1141]|uniref:Transposition protein B n=1 Tax=Neorhizobium galegae bv. officinalis bv. officinalis str. HAMBI 1141 TaxID=1028801 RepID=A0A068T705_NEOGA|nr:Mu transposase C-terminal domain-containing protein [Neorhizobium galegae]CDN53829.1 Transposition protein B [Neorhizobium galegae bv. officinalis bv. officinalis str. HAMBI 1141]
MSIASEKFETLLAKATAILSPRDFALPETPVVQYNTQLPGIAMGERIALYLADKRTFSVYEFKGWQNSGPGMPKTMLFHEFQYATPFPMTAHQYFWLVGQGRALNFSLKPDAGQPQNSLNLTISQRERAHRALEFIDEYFKIVDELYRGKETTAALRVAKKTVSERRQEDPPSDATMYRWIKKSRRRTDDRIAAMAPRRNPGNTLKRKSARFYEALREALIIALSDPEGTYLTIKAAMENLTAEGAEFHDVAAECRKCSDRHYQRILADADPYSKIYLRQGPDAAARLTSARMRLALPDHPLDVVDIDYTTLDVFVFDPTSRFAFGRPNILVFRDRHSGIVLGFYITFGAPSITSFIAGLKHAVFPKDPATLPEGVSWPWFGIPFRIGVDNDMHLIGKDIANAARELGFTLIEYRPGHPWEKGATERLFSILNKQLIHRLPGSTAGSPEERDEFDDEKEKAVPQLRLDELHGFLAHYFAEVHNRSLRAGLGPLITLEDYPCDRWDRGIIGSPTRPPINPDVFTRIVGYTDGVTVQRDGIRLDYLHYWSPELHALKQHPKHRDGKGKHKGTIYQVTRDPNDVGWLYVNDPYRNVVIKLPVIDRDAKYASGLTLFEHQKAIKHHKATIGKVTDSKGLMKARRDLELRMAEFHKRHRKYEPAKALAKFIRSDAAKARLSRIVELTPDEAVDTHIDYFSPEVATPAAKVSDNRRSRLPEPKEVPSMSATGDTATGGEEPVERAPPDIEPDLGQGDDRDPDFDANGF